MNYQEAKQIRVLFGTVIFPEAEAYFCDFLDSLKKQDYEEITLLLINDGVGKEKVYELLKQYSNTQTIVVENENGLSPSELRTEMLLYAKKNTYDLLIIGDSDDTFSENRVSSVVEAYLQGGDFFFNNLVRENGMNVFSKLPNKIIDNSDIIERNYLGLSMISVNINSLSEAFIESLNEYKGYVFDWYFVSRMLLEHKCGLYVKGASTVYRIHDSNYVGITSLNKSNIEKEVKVKKELYHILMKYSSVYEELYEVYLNNDFETCSVDTSQYYWWGLTRRKKDEV